MHLTIFLDALDEYDGPKEFICRFLLDIANMTQTPTKDIRICFSSRPWDIFVTNFHKYPNLRPEDFTREDVMRYCLNSLRNEQISFLDYESLITELVDRSRGVFLWVKLVVKDLAVAIQNNQSREELGKYLRSLPIELDDYYAEIITRIPLSHRWKTYAMLEVAVRPDEPLESREFICAVECSNCKTYAAGIATLLKFRNYSDDNFSGFTQNRSKFYCGGLVEVLNANEIGNVQVLHQTVVDFVCDAKFKTLILQERAKITMDNGWTFLAKYRFLESEILESHGWHITQAVRYAIESEMTTGRSLKMFLDTFPPSFFERGGGDYPCSTTAFGFAALTGLRLYMIETLEVDTQVLDNCVDPPLALAVTRLPNFPDKDIIATTSLILQRRGEWARRPDITVAAMRTIIKRHTLYQWQTAYDESDLDLVALLIDWGISPDIDLQNGLRPIHVASLDLVRLLINKGADVKSLSGFWMTVADYLACAIISANREVLSLVDLLPSEISSFLPSNIISSLPDYSDKFISHLIPHLYFLIDNGIMPSVANIASLKVVLPGFSARASQQLSGMSSREEHSEGRTEGLAKESKDFAFYQNLRLHGRFAQVSHRLKRAMKR